MAYPSIIYGPESEAFNVYTARTPAPGAGAGIFAQRGRLRLGTQLVMSDGRKYRFARNNTPATVIGEVQQSAPILTTDQSMTLAAHAVGATSLNYTHGAATTVINYFAEGYAIISLAPGAGQCYPIGSHIALTSGGTAEPIHLQAGHAVRVALTTTSDLSLLCNPLGDMIVMAATISGMPVGVAVSIIAAAGFGWVQTRGVGAVLGAASNTIGSPGVMLLTGGTAGAVAPASAATQPQVGLIQMVEGTAEWQGLFITLDG